MVRNFVECPSVGISVMFSSWLDWDYGVWGGRAQKSSTIFITLYQGASFQHDLLLPMLTLVTWLRYCLSDFSTVKLYFSPFSIQYSLEGSHYMQPTFMNEEYLHKLFGIFFAWKICLFSPIYLFNHLFLLLYTHVYLFYNQCNVTYFVTQIVSVLAIGSSFCWLLCLFNVFLSPHPTLFCFVLYLVFSNTTESLSLHIIQVPLLYSLTQS